MDTACHGEGTSSAAGLQSGAHRIWQKSVFRCDLEITGLHARADRHIAIEIVRIGQLHKGVNIIGERIVEAAEYLIGLLCAGEGSADRGHAITTGGEV